jgi:uncharacterized protein YdgA (DUF945 family)
MKYFITTAFIIPGCIIIILTGCAYWIGLETEQLAQAPQPGLEIHHIERGWFTSAADSNLRIDSSVLPAQGLALQHRIYHGPLPLSGWPLPALVMIRTKLDPQTLQQLQGLGLQAGQELLTVESRIAFDQSIRHNIHVTPFRLNKPQGNVIL